MQTEFLPMLTKFIEATNGPQNWGKFMVARFTDADWAHRSQVSGARLLWSIGHVPEHVLVLDLQTTEGAFFRPGGLASADLDKHRIWVCPLFEPFLAWLYKQDLTDLSALPDHIDLPDAPFAMAGHRRRGPEEAEAHPLARWPNDWHMKDRLDALLNPDKMHPNGSSSWVSDASAFLELLARKPTP